MPTAVDVLFPLPLGPLRYLLPPGQEAGPVGGRVVAPWQGGVRIGLAVAMEELPVSRAVDHRELLHWLDQEPFVTDGGVGLMLDLARAVSTPPGVVLATLLPVGLRDELLHEVSAIEGVEVMALPPGEWVSADSLGSAELELIRRQGMIRERARPQPRLARRLLAARAADEGLGGSSRANQRIALALLERLGGSDSGAELAREAGVPESAVRALVKKGYAIYAEVPAPPAALPSPPVADVKLEPKGQGVPDQRVALILGGLRRDRLAALVPTLERDLEVGGSVLMLAPEGVVASEAAALLATRLPVLMLSGEFDDDQRRRAWEEAAAGTPLILVGTYPALLAPLPALARVVVLEAGSGSYKLKSGPRVFVPRVAVDLAERRRVPLVLSDALASPEMRLWAGAGRPAPHEGPTGASVAAAVELPRPRQRFFVSDLTRGTGWPVSSDLALVLRQVRERERQAIVLAPRRGFSAALSCDRCGTAVMCPNCDLTLRYHRAAASLRCHQCGYRSAAPDSCPACGGPELGPGRAAGTEWLARAIADLLPDFPVLRLDSDHQDDLEPLRAGGPGVVTATTAVFRLPPLPRVSLVALALLDTYLNVSDFRAAEEATRLLLQLPELAPGGRPLVLVQTFQPEHESLQAVTDERDSGGALTAHEERLLERRRQFRYPPFAQLAKVQVSARQRPAAEREAARLAATLREAGAEDDEILGPVAAPVARIRGQFSFLVYLRCVEAARFRSLLAAVGASSSAVRVRVDVDPRDVAEFVE